MVCTHPPGQPDAHGGEHTGLIVTRYACTQSVLQSGWHGGKQGTGLTMENGGGGGGSSGGPIGGSGGN